MAFTRSNFATLFAIIAQLASFQVDATEGKLGNLALKPHGAFNATN